ncbi:MAG: hypothetical protein OXL38_04665 [Gammaproteobacteria bacterium]|nr:hypothetical protein [Gammaproteobacteria bacterium]
MNDPLVAALIYKVRNDESVDYSNAKPLEHEDDGFRVKVADGTARFEMKQHHATEHEARAVVEPFIRNWEFDACFGSRHEHFHLDFDRAEIVDRNPDKGDASGSIHVSGALVGTLEVAAVIKYLRYPPPPPKIDSDHPDVRTLDDRHRRYRGGEDRLPAFAYYCFTELLRQAQGGVPEVARRYNVSRPVLRKV